MHFMQLRLNKVNWNWFNDAKNIFGVDSLFYLLPLYIHDDLNYFDAKKN